MFGKNRSEKHIISVSKTTVLRKRIFFLFLVFLFCTVRPLLGQVINITDKRPSSLISASLDEMVDSGQTISTPFEALHSSRFTRNKGRIPVFPNSVNSAWFRFAVSNHSESAKLFLNIAYPNLSRVSLYRIDSGSVNPVLIGQEGMDVFHTPVIAGSPNLVFDLELPPGAANQYLLHVYSEHPIIVPGEIYTYDAIHHSINLQTIVSGLYLGVLSIMFLYNLFLFFGTRDNNYLYYVVYILFLALAQTTAAGYEYRYIWPSHPGINKYAVVFTSTLSLISGLLFSMHFLRTSLYVKKMHKWLQFLAIVYITGMVCCVFSLLDISYDILNYNGLISVISVLISCVVIAKKGFRPAYFYLIAWLLLLISFSILVLRNLSVLPYNNFTTYVFYFGSAVEVALLSIALADKITILRKEKEESQAEALLAARENEKLVKDQNIMLERKVSERTEELQFSNNNLSTALQDLKDTQIQLVDAEKMASLGQLTAGIAHEINNPINFVKSNIKPLQLDIKDLMEVIDAYDTLHTVPDAELPAKLSQIEKLKNQIDISYVRTEIDSLVKGIQEGAERTAEIVMGLRNFSRLDESEVKTVNIHEGIDSTLVLLKNTLPENIVIKKDFQAQGEIECYPGKMNQVFMNILSNGIQAIKEKEEQGDESITITTHDLGDKIEIRIKDTGIGMTDEVRQKIFDPFFTTKDVGEGTGLGLSIVYKIIQKHAGKIEVVSTRGKGAEFIISLYKVLPESALS
jgi:signal transduction histidine kinase